MSNSWYGSGKSVGHNSKIYGGIGVNSFNIRNREVEDKRHANEKYMRKELMSMLDITDKDLLEKDEAWIKSKIRQFKIKMIND